MSYFWSNPVASFASNQRGYEIDRHGVAVFKLKEFLGPGGRYRYDDLSGWMEQARARGLEVMLLSVPEFPMVYASLIPSKKPWCLMDVGRRRCFRSAREAIRG